MKRGMSILVFVSLAWSVAAQDMPPNPQPGKCYVRCTEPDVWEEQTVQVMVKPAYKVVKVIPAEFKTVTERVMVKAPSKRLKVIPAKWGTETVRYVKKEKATKITIVPATFEPSVETVEIVPEHYKWVVGPVPGCDDPGRDCRAFCYQKVPAEFTTIPIEKLAKDASIVKETIPEEVATYEKKIVLEPARVVEEEIPAEYAEITKTVLVKDADTVVQVVPAVYKTVTKKVLVKKGGLTKWKEVQCELLDYNILPIHWNLGSAVLTEEAKRVIDKFLMPVIQANPGVKIEIASHTDSRGSKEFNRALSQRRAEAVVNYLVSKGVDRSLLVPVGYGESRLKNHCSDGVPCSESEHAVNRRTEFRLIQ